MPITTRFTEMFDCRHPLQQAGIGGMTSPALAVAVAEGGALGMLTGTIGRDALAAQLDQVKAHFDTFGKKLPVQFKHEMSEFEERLGLVSSAE